MAVSCAMFDSAKRLCDGSTRHISASSVSMAEAIAIHDACCLARARGLVGASIFSDSKAVL